MSGYLIEDLFARARIGSFRGMRHSFKTPVFMPVGTRGSIRMYPYDLVEKLGFEIVLANTYHMMLRPGSELVSNLGGLHKFTGWDGAILTDSGGFQVMSLDAAYDESGVNFKSVYDGSKISLTPESAVRIQEELGSDIAMMLDVCTMLPADEKILRDNLHVTLRWGERAKRAHSRTDQALFGIVQGGTSASLRKLSVEGTAALDFDGYAIGGLAVGEERSTTLETVDLCTSLLPEDKPRYLMGVGDPYSVVHAIELGVDMFDCVAPTRVARHGMAWTSEGKVSVKKSQYISSDEPLDPSCSCDTCLRYPVALLNHLFRVDRETCGLFLTRHNLTFMRDLIARTRIAIADRDLRGIKEFVETFYR